MELTLKMDDGTVVKSKQFEITMTSISTTKNGTFARIGLSFFTDNAKLVNALFTEMRKKARFLQVNGRTLAAGVFSSQAIQYISGKGRPSPKFSEYEKGKEMLLVRGDADVDFLPIRDRKQDLCSKSCIRHTATLLQQAIPGKKKVHSGGHPQGDIRASALPPVRLPDTPDDQGRQVQPS